MRITLTVAISVNQEGKREERSAKELLIILVWNPDSIHWNSVTWPPLIKKGGEYIQLSGQRKKIRFGCIVVTAHQV